MRGGGVPDIVDREGGGFSPTLRWVGGVPGTRLPETCPHGSGRCSSAGRSPRGASHSRDSAWRRETSVIVVRLFARVAIVGALVLVGLMSLGAYLAGHAFPGELLA